MDKKLLKSMAITALASTITLLSINHASAQSPSRTPVNEKNCVPVYKEKVPERDGRWFERHAEGSFFGEQPEIICDDEEEKPLETPKPTPVKPSEVKKPEPIKPVEPTAPAPMSMEWLRTNVPKYLDAAMENPTPENVRVYYFLQRYALDKAEKFSQASQRVVMGDPMLDEESRRSASTFGGQRLDAEATLAKNSLLGQLKEKSALFFFFDSTCRYCQAQAKTVAALQRLGFYVISVSVDGKGFDSGLFPDFKQDKGQAQKLGVQVVPALYLATPDSKTKPYIPLQQGGVVPQDEIENRMLVAALAAEIITEEDFNKTRPFRVNTKYELDKRLKEKPLPTNGNVKNGGFIDPKIMNEYIKGLE